MVSDSAQTPDPFEIHRRVRLYVLLAAAALLVAGGFAAISWHQREPLFAIPAVILFVLALFQLRGLGDAGTPLLLADDHGVRMRHGDGWIGLLWSEMAEVRVEARAGWRHDARVKVVSADGLRVYSTPLGLATTVSPVQAQRELALRRDTAAY